MAWINNGQRAIMARAHHMKNVCDLLGRSKRPASARRVLDAMFFSRKCFKQLSKNFSNRGWYEHRTMWCVFYWSVVWWLVFVWSLFDSWVINSVTCTHHWALYIFICPMPTLPDHRAPAHSRPQRPLSRTGVTKTLAWRTNVIFCLFWANVTEAKARRARNASRVRGKLRPQTSDASNFFF